MTKCPPLCGRVKIKEKERKKREKRVATLAEEKIIRWVINDKEDWGREEEIEEDYRKTEEMVPRKVEESVWEGRVGENANKKSLGLCYRSQGNIQTTERKDLFSIKE